MGSEIEALLSHLQSLKSRTPRQLHRYYFPTHTQPASDVVATPGTFVSVPLSSVPIATPRFRIRAAIPSFRRILGLEGKPKSPSSRSRSAVMRLMHIYSNEMYHMHMGSSKHQRMRNIVGTDATCKLGAAEVNAIAAISLTAFSKASWLQGVMYILQHMIKHRMYGSTSNVRVNNVLELWKYNPAFKTFARHHVSVFDTVVTPHALKLSKSSMGVSVLYTLLATGFFVTIHNGGVCGYKPVAELLLRSADAKNKWSLVQTYRYLCNLLYEVLAKNIVMLDAMIGLEYANMAAAVKWSERALIRSYRASWVKQLFGF